jgi:hypothetical protein
MFLLCSLFRRCVLRYVHGNDQRDSQAPIPTPDRWGIEFVCEYSILFGELRKTDDMRPNSLLNFVFFFSHYEPFMTREKWGILVQSRNMYD